MVVRTFVKQVAEFVQELAAILQACRHILWLPSLSIESYDVDVTLSPIYLDMNQPSNGSPCDSMGWCKALTNHDLNAGTGFGTVHDVEMICNMLHLVEKPGLKDYEDVRWGLMQGEPVHQLLIGQASTVPYHGGEPSCSCCMPALLLGFMALGF